jgi:hypothetical protein
MLTNGLLQLKRGYANTNAKKLGGGYQTIKHENLAVENGAVLAYEVMKKNLPNATAAVIDEARVP